MSGATEATTMTCEIAPAHDAPAAALVTVACARCQRQGTLAMCSRDEADAGKGILACPTCCGVLKCVGGIRMPQADQGPSGTR